MRDLQADSLSLPCQVSLAPVGLALRHSPRWCVCLPVRHSSTFLRPFAPRPLRRFNATTDALTPVGLALRCKHMNTSLSSTQVSLIHARDLPDHSVVNHPVPPCHRFNTLPLSVAGFHSLSERSGFRHSLAGSSQTPGRITFVILRTDRSPPVAPHPASRRRSDGRLQVGERRPEEDFHLSDCARFQAHECGGSTPLLLLHQIVWQNRCFRWRTKSCARSQHSKGCRTS